MAVRQCYPAASNLDGVSCNSHVLRSGLAIAGGGEAVGWRGVEPRKARHYKVPGKGGGYALGLAALLFGAGSGLSGMAGEIIAEGCQARWSETELVIGNSNIERRWSIQEGLVKATSFRDLNSGTEWIESAAGRGGHRPAGERAKGTNSVSVTAHASRFGPVGAGSLVVELTAYCPETRTAEFQAASR